MIRVLVVIALAVGAHILSGSMTRAEALLRADGHLLKWRSHAPGAVTVISYAVLSGDFTVSGDKRTLSPDNCGAMHAFADIIAKSPDVSVETAKQELKAAFEAWEGAAALTFVEVDDPNRANIIIGAAHSPGGRAFANLSFRTDQGQTPLAKGLGKTGLTNRSIPARRSIMIAATSSQSSRPTFASAHSRAGRSVSTAMSISMICGTPSLTRSAMPSVSIIQANRDRLWLSAMKNACNS